MHPVLILTRNCLELTKKCVASVMSQDVTVSITIFDNGSTDGTAEWAMDIANRGDVWEANANLGVSMGWNLGLEALFKSYDHVLVLNNDTEIPPYFYRELLNYELPFVTGASVSERNFGQPKFSQAYPGPDFSAFLIRKECWEKVGRFDERFKHYVGDCAYHVEATRSGIQLLNSGIPFYHERSSTLKLASDEDRNEIQMQADRDRETFKRVYGCMPWEPAYAELFTSDQPQT
jgi:GT2 family glycosyltransferase